MATDWEKITREAQEQLEEYAPLLLDADQLSAFSRGIASGEIGPHSNLYPTDPQPVGEEAVDVLDGLPAAERERLGALGRSALAAGEVAVAVLNGGMATRFGGRVKGVVEAVTGLSFLEIKLAQAQREYALPFVIMNSFATDAATRAFLSKRGLLDQVSICLQRASIRLTPQGDAFRDPSHADPGKLSLYAPGHGDFPGALRDTGLIASLAERGVRAIQLSNVDNLGAEPDPVIVGYHLDREVDLTCEVAAVAPGDAGGTPARVGDRVEVVEGFRFSRDFDFGRLKYLASNTFLFSLDVLREPHPLTWFYVEKTVGSERVVQMERLVNELSSRAPTAFLATPRGGPTGRFFPVKSPADLEALQADPDLVQRFSRV